MKQIFQLSAAIASFIIVSCNDNGKGSDASGTFEADEVVVSTLATGKLLSLNIEEGSVLAKDSVVGFVDPAQLNLQKQEVEAAIESLGQQTLDAEPQISLLQKQIAVQQSQLENLLHEKIRIENLLKQDAATGKQLDDITAQIDVVKRQMNVTQQQIHVQKNNVATQNRGVLSNRKPLQKKIAQLEDLLKNTGILNPIHGTVITKYAEAGEIVTQGKALYKIADLTSVFLRAYITASQLSKVKLNQSVKVMRDDGAKKYKEYGGIVTWISDKAEFTPKTIQTKEERANLVYAIRVKVKNDGYIKIGMYGELKL